MRIERWKRSNLHFAWLPLAVSYIIITTGSSGVILSSQYLDVALVSGNDEKGGLKKLIITNSAVG